MGSSTWLEKVAELHEEWIKMAKAYGAGADAEDLVQESYIKLLRYDCKDKIIKKGEISKGFMFFVVKNTVLNYHKKNSRSPVHYVEEVSRGIPEEERTEYEQAYNEFCERVDDVTKQWKWSDRQIFDDYRFSEDSIRGIGKKYNISFVSIFGTIKECKNHLLYELKEDWEDLQNGDFDKI